MPGGYPGEGYYAAIYQVAPGQETGVGQRQEGEGSLPSVRATYKIRSETIIGSGELGARPCAASVKVS